MNDTLFNVLLCVALTVSLVVICMIRVSCERRNRRKKGGRRK